MMGPFPSILLFYSILPLFYQGTQSSNTTSDRVFISDDMHTGSYNTTMSTSVMQNGTTADLEINGTMTGSQSETMTSEGMYISDEMHTSSQDTTTSISVMQNGTTVDLDLNGTLRGTQSATTASDGMFILSYNTTTSISMMQNGTTADLKIKGTMTGSQSATTASDGMFISDEMHTGSHNTATSTSVMQNGTTADLDLNETLRHEQPFDFQISAVRTPESKSEMHVGMKMKLKVCVSFPQGYYKEVTLTVSQGIQNIDVESQSCVLGRVIRAETSEKSSVNYENTGFLRTHEMSFITKSVNVSFSDVQSDYQLVCNYEIYLHNAVNLTDRQNVPIPCLVQVTSSTSFVQNFETAAVFIARTSILEMNKTASFGPATPSWMHIEPKVVKNFVFRAWIPYYNPQIKVKLEGDEKFQSDYVALFLEVTKVGKNFYPGADGKNDSTCKWRWSTSQQPLVHTFPSQWVNRGYYENKSTTDDDLLEFEALVAMSNTAKRGLDNNYTLTAIIILNDVPVWNTSVNLFVQDPSLNVSSKVSILDVLPCETLPKTKNSSIVLKLEIPDGRADKLDLIILTKKITGDRQSAVVIENVHYIIETPYAACYNFDVNYFNNSLSIQNKADVALRYVDRVASSMSSKVNLTISADLRIVQEKSTFGEYHEVSAIFGNTSTVLCNITVKDPDIYNDIYGIILSKLNLLLDKENSSCINLPIKGDNPPLLWMRMQTPILGISPAPFNVTVRGKGISCQRHGQKLLQVSFPKSLKSGFHGETNFCSSTMDVGGPDKSSRDCVYHCPCAGNEECGEIILFMANHGSYDTWSLCEVYAKNV